MRGVFGVSLQGRLAFSLLVLLSFFFALEVGLGQEELQGIAP